MKMIKPDLSGRRFHHLLVIKPTYGKFLCKCDCGNYREYTRWHFEEGKVKSCGCRRGAFVKLNRTTPLKDRFFMQVRKTTHCWIFTGHVDQFGYGAIRVNRTMVKAHRVSYELAHGAIDHNLQIDHLCMNKSCVNPKHLELVTRAVNIRRANAARKWPSDTWEQRKTRVRRSMSLMKCMTASKQRTTQ